jgi:hypothetical protein
MFDRIKQHVKDHKEAYIAGGVGLGIGAVGVAIGTRLIVGDNVSLPISRGISVTAERGISVLGKRVVMNNVSYISSNRSGPPSWVVRCVETNAIFSSQSGAASEMNLSASEISKHLNGMMDNVRGYHFERICMAA